jgi:hypothetical protein
VTTTGPNGSLLSRNSATATFDDHPGAPGGHLAVPSPLLSLTLTAGQPIGVVVSQ